MIDGKDIMIMLMFVLVLVISSIGIEAYNKAKLADGNNSRKVTKQFLIVMLVLSILGLLGMIGLKVFQASQTSSQPNLNKMLAAAVRGGNAGTRAN